MMQFDGMNMRYVNNGGGASYTGDAQGALDEVYTNSGNWNGVVNTVSSNSASWTGGGGGIYSQSALLYQGSKSDAKTTAWALTGNVQDYSIIQCDWVDTNNYYISKQIPIPSGLGTDMTRAAFFDAVFEYGSDLWCKAQRFSAQTNHVYAQVDEYCVHTNNTITNVGSDVSNNRPIMVQIIGIK